MSPLSPCQQCESQFVACREDRQAPAQWDGRWSSHRNRGGVVHARTAGPRLREENARRLTAGECTIGIDYELSEEERKDRAALNSAFRSGKAAGKRCHWKGGGALRGPRAGPSPFPGLNFPSS